MEKRWQTACQGKDLKTLPLSVRRRLGQTPRAWYQRSGPLKEGSGVFLVFGAEGLDVAQAGVIVDADVDMFPASPAFLSPSVSRDPMADASDDAAQLLDIDVKQISGVGMFVAPDRLWGCQCS